jgi:hypothetical protein
MGIRDPIPRETARDVLEMGVLTRRLIHPAKWVDDMIAEAGADSFAGQFGSI